MKEKKTLLSDKKADGAKIIRQAFLVLLDVIIFA